jgi:hypothetical protein
MATPNAESAEPVVDLAALESGRTSTAAALDRLARAGAEAQAELALLRADQAPRRHGAHPSGSGYRAPAHATTDAMVGAPEDASVDATTDLTRRLRPVSGALEQE